MKLNYCSSPSGTLMSQLHVNVSLPRTYTQWSWSWPCATVQTNKCAVTHHSEAAITCVHCLWALCGGSEFYLPSVWLRWRFTVYYWGEHGEREEINWEGLESNVRIGRERNREVQMWRSALKWGRVERWRGVKRWMGRKGYIMPMKSITKVLLYVYIYSRFWHHILRSNYPSNLIHCLPLYHNMLSITSWYSEDSV